VLFLRVFGVFPLVTADWHDLDTLLTGKDGEEGLMYLRPF
jgi:hypothetical protein